jgi:hypothetical protein
MNAQPLNPADVEQVFSELLAKNGQVTSLEVKEELRTRGFWATQAIVGPEVRAIAARLGIQHTDNGMYWTYFSSTTSTPAAVNPTDSDGDEEEDEDDASGSMSSSVSGIPASPVVPQKVRVPPADPADREPVVNPASGDWTVHDIHNGPSASLAFQAKLTESQAKYAYKLKMANVLYTDVRAKRLN